MKSRIVLSALLALAVIHARPATAAVARFQTSADSKATFTALGQPGIIRINGKGAPVNGELTLDAASASGRFELDLEKFETGIGLRDRHMREKYLETPKYPKAVLEIESVSLPTGFAPGQELRAARFKGKLTLKGTTKPVEGEVDVAGAEMRAQARFGFRLADFPVGVPSYMGITVADKVDVSVDIPGFVKK